MAFNGSPLKRTDDYNPYSFPMPPIQPINQPYVPPVAPPYVPERGDWVRSRTIGINPIRSPIPGDIQEGTQAIRYSLLAKNPIVKAALDRRLVGTFFSKWDIESANDYVKHPEFEELDNILIDDIMDQIAELQYETFDNVMKAITRDSWEYGFSVSEIIFSDDQDYQERGKWRVIAIKPKVPFNFNMWGDDVGNLNRLQEQTWGQWYREEELNKFIITTWPNKRDGNYYGQSELQSIMQDIRLVEILEEFEAQGIKSLAVKPILMWYSGDMSAEQLRAYQSSLYQMQSGTLVSLEGSRETNTGKFVKEVEVEVLDDRASADGVELTRAVIEMLQRRINHTLGTPNDIGFTSTENGSLAKAEVESDFMKAASLFDAAFVESFVNRQIIPAMIRYNWTKLPDRYRLPVLRFSAVKEFYRNMDRSAQLEMLEKNAITLDEFRDTLSMGTAPEELRALRNTTAVPVEGVEGETPVEPGMEGGLTEDQVLNGAQVTAATTIVQSVADGTLPRDSGIAQIKIFFNLTEAQATEIMGSAGLEKLESTVAPEPEKPMQPGLGF